MWNAGMLHDEHERAISGAKDALTIEVFGREEKKQKSRGELSRWTTV